jgi:hypothetical protein
MLRAYEAFLIKKGRGSDFYSFLNEPPSSRFGSEEKKQFLLYVAQSFQTSRGSATSFSITDSTEISTLTT